MTTVADAPALGSFSDVDTEPDTGSLIAALDEQTAIPAIQRLRAAATDLLRARLGDRLVDVGCGTGDLARALAGRVGPTGTVLGIDASETMLTEARRRAGTSTLPVEFRLGDVTNLDLDDACYDGTVCERVLQHVASPDAAMAELVRVTRPGGRIVVIDTDWGLHAIHGADPTLTATIVNCWAGNAANGLAGRQLPALFVDAGLRDPIVIARDHDHHRPLAPVDATVHDHGRRCRRRRRDQRGRRRRLAAPARRGRSTGPLLLGTDDVRRGQQPPQSPALRSTASPTKGTSNESVRREPRSRPRMARRHGGLRATGRERPRGLHERISPTRASSSSPAPSLAPRASRIRVLLIADADDETDIRQRLADDPWELADRIATTTIEPWTLLVGALAQA